MRPVRINGHLPTPLGAPKGWDEERDGHCAGLFVREDLIENRLFLSSAHAVDDWEALAMYAGATLRLSVGGPGHPVVNMGLEAIPDDHEPVMMARQFNAPDGRRYVRVEMMFAKGRGHRGYADVHVDGTLADAVSTGIIRVESLAREKGWIE